MDRLKVLTSDGVAWVDVRSDADASELGSYWNAVRHYRRTGDDADLWPFEGRQIAGLVLETNPDTIDYWASAGELDFEDIYEEG